MENSSELQRIQSIFDSWLTLQSTKEEVESLYELRSCLCRDADGDTVEESFLHSSQTPNVSLQDLGSAAKAAGLQLKEEEDLDWLVFYVFDRRFGWPDLHEEEGLLVVTQPERTGARRRSGRQEELRHKQQLISCLDTLISWLMQQSVEASSVLTIASASRIAAEAPVTRCQLVLHAFDWLRERLKQPDEATFLAVCQLVCQSLSDIWSQIRSSAVARIGAIVDELSLEHIDQLFHSVANLCETEVNTWQAVDGGISGLHAIMKRFQLVGCSVQQQQQHQADCGSSSPRVHSQIRIGKHQLDQLPPLIHQRLKGLAFGLVANGQPTIRETAVKALVTCLVCCGSAEIESAFHDTYQRLAACCEGFDDLDCPTLSESFHFMEPYCAESLLNLCLLLLKRIRDPHSHILQNWQLYHKTLDIYLMHPASSVRQACSSLYTHAIGRSVSNPQQVKFMLHCLMQKWRPDQSVLLQPVEKILKAQLTGQGRASIVDFADSSVDTRQWREGDVWEWREGRLLVCELVCKLLLKNHSLCVTTADNWSGAKSMSHSDSTNHRRSGKAAAASAAVTAAAAASATSRCRSSTISEEFPPASDGLLSFSEKQALGRRNSQSDSRQPSANIHRLGPISDGQVQQYVSPLSFLLQVKQLDLALCESPPSSPTPSSSAASALPSFRSQLCQMLHTCAESLADSSWELRRMGRQAFVSVAQLLLAYDQRLFERTVSTHLSAQPSVMTFCSLWLIRDAAIQQQQHQQPQLHESWLASCRHYAQELPLHCVSIMAVDILLIAADTTDSCISCLRRIDAAVQQQELVEIDLTLVSTLSVSANATEFLLTMLRSCSQRLLQTCSSTKSVSKTVVQLLPLCIGWLHVCRQQRIDSQEVSRLLLHCIASVAQRMLAAANGEPEEEGMGEGKEEDDGEGVRRRRWTEEAVGESVAASLLAIARIVQERPDTWRAYSKHLMPPLRCLLSLAARHRAVATDAVLQLLRATAHHLPAAITSPVSDSNCKSDLAPNSRSSSRADTKRQQFQLFASQSTVKSDDMLDSVSIGSESDGGSLVDSLAQEVLDEEHFISDTTPPAAATATAAAAVEAAESIGKQSDSDALSNWDSSSTDSDLIDAYEPASNGSSTEAAAGTVEVQDVAELIRCLRQCDPQLLAEGTVSLSEQQRQQLLAIASVD